MTELLITDFVQVHRTNWKESDEVMSSDRISFLIIKYQHKKEYSYKDF